ncbi:MAG TPA: glycosyl transferase family 9 [Planctomycetaceae bacterium]|mgnify:CR=1 FL=1|nr:glycosyl transferase family 9 [Blastopirellula sp.]HAY81480.1 glycosyl transferase family 9 [Planctomycetaceae bacterium]
MVFTVRNNSPLRVLISDVSELGDAVLTMPLACAIKDHDPNAFVAWVAEPAAATMLQGHDCIDQLVTVDEGWLKSPQAICHVRQQLRSLQCDVVIDPPSHTKSSLIGWLSGARQRIGFDGPQARELALWLNRTKLPREREHVVDARLQLLTPLGVQDPMVRFEVPHDPSADVFAREYVLSMELADGFAMIHPGAAEGSQVWSMARFATVARHLGEVHGLPTIVAWANGKEHHFAESIVAGSMGYAMMAPHTSLRELTALMRQAQLLISADHSPLHLAAAVGVPCVALYGATADRFAGPYGEQHVTLQAPWEGTASRARRPSTQQALRAITAEAVCEACDQVLQTAMPELCYAA